MVFVKVRETYDLKTVQDKMTVIGIHTPNPDIIKKTYPGLLMQCKSYRPYSCDVRVACASVLPLDPLSVGTSAGNVAPEDVFNPILYKAMSNFGMSQLEARINGLTSVDADVNGNGALVDVDTFTSAGSDFPAYYGLLSNTHEWKHAPIQAGLEMTGLKPLVWELLYNVGDSITSDNPTPEFSAPDENGDSVSYKPHAIRGNAKPFPFIPCTSYSLDLGEKEAKVPDPQSYQPPGFPVYPANCSTTVPWMRVFCGAIIVPPSKLHSLYFRMVVEWTIEFTGIRPLGEITAFSGLAELAPSVHYQNYTYDETKKALTGSSDSIMDSDTCMVSSNVEVNKVM